MPPATFRLVLLVSCAHAMVHTFEHALPAVEQMIGADFGVGREQTGALGTVWRLPFGLAAMIAGWLADRYGARRLLIIYLLGGVATAALAAWAPTLVILFGVMFAMGCFASIYHPAGLSLISRETTAETRGAALGWHGIFGSLGIASAPFLASIVFSTGLVGWRGFYLVLTVPALVIAAMLTRLPVHANESARDVADAASFGSPSNGPEAGSFRHESLPEERIPWRPFLLLVAAGALSGFVYAGFLQFLPRYLNDTGLRPSGWSAASFRNALATVALLCAAVGQGIAGRMADPDRLEKQLVWILLGNVPPLLWMAFADGAWRIVAACLLAFIHFMNQPIYNSLVAKAIPAHRRSVGYGFSNMVCFGIGAFGPLVAGLLPTERLVYTTLGGVAAAAAAIAMLVNFTPVGRISNPSVTRSD
jgi:MFS transporter, FSR family, fosmidomycin resistance protein